jgi:putative ABC transport system substrate-binding protein
MRRRELITLLAGLAGTAAWPRAVRAQQAERMRRIGALIGLPEGDPEGIARIGALMQGLEKLGWSERRNFQLDLRWAGADAGHLQALAADLVASKPDLIFAASGSPLAALYRETRTIPVVFANSNDPVSDGFVQSLARPGGNITGFTLFENAVAVKWLELLKHIAPNVTRAGVIYDPAQPSSAGYVRTLSDGAPPLELQISTFAVRNAADIDSAITSFANERGGGLLLASPVTVVHAELLVDLAACYRLPAVYPYRYFVVKGGLASYGVELLDLYRRAAVYVDRILRGEKPGELPIQQATKFELIINLKTAKALDLSIPVSVFARTDELIE